MKYLLLFCFALALLSCHSQSDPIDYVALGFPEEAIEDKPLPVPLAEYNFHSFTFDSAYSDFYEQGLATPHVYLEAPELDSLVDGDEVLIDTGTAYLMIGYPVKEVFLQEINSANGKFTRRDMVELISGSYHLMYQERQTEAPNEKVGAGDIPTLSELHLYYMRVFKGQSGKLYVELRIFP